MTHPLRAVCDSPLAVGGDPAYVAPMITVVEHPDADGARWLAALTLLIEAGRTAENQERG